MLVQNQSHRGPLAFAPAYDAHRTVVCFWEARICFPKVIYTNLAKMDIFSEQVSIYYFLLDL